MIYVDRQLSLDFAMDQRFCNVKEMRSQFLNEIDRQFFFKACNLNFSTCFKVCSVREFEVVLTSRRFFFIIRGVESIVESIALSSSMRIVPESTTRGTVYQRSNLPGFVDGSTSSRVATDYH